MKVTRQNSESNKAIQRSILIVKEKSNEQLILTQFFHGKGEHVCINNIRRGSYNQSLDIEALFS